MYTYIPISPPSCVSLPPTLPIPPLQVITKHQADLPVLCGCFPLAIYFTFGSVYMSMLLFHFVPASSSPPHPNPRPQVHSLHLCLYSCPATRFILYHHLSASFLQLFYASTFRFYPFMSNSSVFCFPFTPCLQNIAN